MYSKVQEREILTACVLVSLGSVVRDNIPGLVSAINSIFRDEFRKLEAMPHGRQAKKERNPADEKLYSVLKEVQSLPGTLDGIRKLEGLRSKAESVPGLLPIVKKCFDVVPAFFRFPGFGSLVKHNAISKFIEFAMSWRYTGKGYEPPDGMSAPFSGYDDIIGSLMAHPLCKAEMAKQTKLWEESQKHARAKRS
jgi:hypothetical protein